MNRIRSLPVEVRWMQVEGAVTVKASGEIYDVTPMQFSFVAK
jgi:hypothetical protein